MAVEIEHKFLVVNDNWRSQISRSVRYCQAYLSSAPTSSIRIRISDQHAWLNIKSATLGTQRLEYEYEIPLADANELLANLCRKPIIEKTRHFIYHASHLWEIDEFLGDNDGLIVAEVELQAVGEHFEKPDWLGQDVTEDKRYYNNNLVNHPYCQWRD